MRIVEEHRAGPRWPSRLDAIADYVPWEVPGRWWENIEVRATDVSECGLRLITTSEVKPGAKIRLVIAPRTDTEEPATLEGEIVWVREPWVPLFGVYRAGVRFKPPLQPGVEEVLARVGAERIVEPAV